jgi:hypothetical protein
MNVTLFMAIAVLGSAGLNFLHWLSRKDSRLLYTPKSGWSRIGLIALSVGSGLCAVLFLAGRIPGLAFLAFAFGLSFAHELYSIWRRHRQHSA